MSARDLAVIVVTWNVRDLALQTLRSLYDDLAGSGLDAQVIVVDSASSDGTVAAVRAQFPQTDVIAFTENLGFGRANNLGLKHVGFGSSPAEMLPRAVYLLNPDTITRPGATRTLFDALFAESRAGLVGAQLSYSDGAFQHSAFAFPGLRQLWAEFFPTPGRWVEGAFNGRYPRALYAGLQPFPVDFVLGATMMLRREVVLQTGGFDERFFMYCEEIDWAWRIRKAGWQVYCVPAAHVVHLGGQSTGQAKAVNTLHLWRSRLRLYALHHPRWKSWFARGIIAAGMSLKARAARRRGHTELAEAYRQIRTMALYPLTYETNRHRPDSE